jgi:hypothetical protein
LNGRGEGIVMQEEDTKRRIEKVLRDEININELVFGCLHDIHQGKYNQELLSAICQKNIGKYDIYDAYVFLKIYSAIQTGRVLFDTVNIGVTPYSDSAIDENNKALKNLPPPFIAKFIPEKGGSANDDGYLTSDCETLQLKRINNGEETLADVLFLDVSLEVGTTASHKTFEHVLAENGVARWAYGSETLYIFYNAFPFSLEGGSLLLDK